MKTAVDISKDYIVKVAVKMINLKGWDALNARSLAKELSISTKPLYRIYKNMDEIKKDIYKEIKKQYDEYLTSRIDSKKALLTLCIAYVEFALEYKNLFIALFLKNNLNWNSIENVLDEKWNQSTIINLVNKMGLSFEAAKGLFLNMWLYANGLATLIATNELDIKEDDILVKMVGIYKVLTNTLQQNK